ncbi:Pyruvate kinase 1 [Halomicronema hongdechloris C2206]|uniref:Pyruvate kinase n=1 Tax=Halomicronema hongdechloris C2206 TaxID=1641165 RepID=A0A1Z3HIK0_9CYAN|nr:pyruvate kinase [Halomicronema hongdechloris]ASC70125.1 Pyruvate kinase 1 [Halomicronema hongdechloris C2206]
MHLLPHRTKIVATIGPASSSRDTIQHMIRAGMSVARLNFSHGSYDDHAQRIRLLRQVAQEHDTPITLLQDLQGPKIRVGALAEDGMQLAAGKRLTLLPSDHATGLNQVTIDYPHLAADARPGMTILLDDGLLELQIEAVEPPAVHCRVIQGGPLRSRKGVNLPDLTLRLPSLTAKDREDLKFGLSQGVDMVSLSFVRRAEDVQALKQLLATHGAADVPVLAKIEKPQAIANLEAILAVCDAVMVARGDLGVEMRAEKVPMLQKRIIRACNLRKLPVITATQMLDSMIHNPRPTRAEASDVANAIIDGTDAVMLSGESAVGAFPVESVQMLGRIAADIEPELEFVNNPPAKTDETHALSEALNVIDKVLDLRCIVSFTASGYTAMIAAGERPRAPVIALTPNVKVYHRLNLVWGVKPILVDTPATSFEAMTQQADQYLCDRTYASPGDKVLIMGGIPAGISQGTNFIKIHTIGN